MAHDFLGQLYKQLHLSPLGRDGSVTLVTLEDTLISTNVRLEHHGLARQMSVAAIFYHSCVSGIDVKVEQFATVRISVETGKAKAQQERQAQAAAAAPSQHIFERSTMSVTIP